MLYLVLFFVFCFLSLVFRISVEKVIKLSVFSLFVCLFVYIFVCLFASFFFFFLSFFLCFCFLFAFCLFFICLFVFFLSFFLFFICLFVCLFCLFPAWQPLFKFDSTRTIKFSIWIWFHEDKAWFGFSLVWFITAYEPLMNYWILKSNSFVNVWL